MYVTERGRLGLIGSLEDWMQKIKDQNQKIWKLKAFKPFLDRGTDIVTYREYMQSKRMSYGSLDQRQILGKDLGFQLKRRKSYKPR